MRAIISAVLALQLALTGPALAQDPGTSEAMAAWQADPRRVFDAAEVDIDEFKWIARPVVVFADSPADPAYREQMDRLAERQSDLVRRDVVVIADSDPAAASDLRRKLRPRGFMLVLMGKDGTVELRKPFPWHVREIVRVIDKMPMRRQEIRDSGRTGG